MLGGVGVAPHCHWVLIGDVVFILDARCGRYYGLDPGDTRSWLALVGGPEHGDGATAEAVQILRADSVARGWMGVAKMVPRRVERAGQGVSALRAYVCLLTAAWLTRIGGFARAYRWAQARGGARRPQGGDLAVARSAFARAEGFAISRLGLEDCLPRSLALFVFLGGAGFAVRHRIGVRRYPFLAHAWVEHDGVDLLGSGAADSFTPIATIYA
jgi:hypothetical protein